MHPIEAVLFDFHSTLVDNGSPRNWLLRGLRKLVHSSSEEDVSSDVIPANIDDDVLLAKFEKEILLDCHLAAPTLDERKRLKKKKIPKHATLDEFLQELNRIWEIAKETDPLTIRDIDPLHHRRVFDEIMLSHFDIPLDLSHALYGTLTDNWIAYQDAKPMLDHLRSKGIKLGLISNVGFDIRPVLVREGLIDYFHAIVLSCEFGECKPSRNVFLHALDKMQVKHDACLMVGDDAHADGAAALVGMRTLIIPRTHGPVHGLSLVSKLV